MSIGVGREPNQTARPVQEGRRRFFLFFVVAGFNLEVRNHEFIVFLGPSGCGKSTILRMIAGLEDISGGELSIDGQVVNQLSPRERNIAMVFQNYALYPHMSVRDNITFGLRRMKIAPAAMKIVLLRNRVPLEVSTKKRPSSCF